MPRSFDAGSPRDDDSRRNARVPYGRVPVTRHAVVAAYMHIGATTMRLPAPGPVSCARKVSRGHLSAMRVLTAYARRR